MQGLNLLRQGMMENPRTATSNTADNPQSSVIRMITITALFHPARRWRRRHARRLGSDSRGRSRGRNRRRDFGSRRIARRILENAIEIADLHWMLLDHGRQGSGELIDFPRSDTT